MAPDPPNPAPRATFFGDDNWVDEALARAWEDTVRRHRRLGAPMYVWGDGRVQAVDPHTLPLPEDGTA